MHKFVADLVIALIAAGLIVYWGNEESSSTHTTVTAQAQGQAKSKSSIRRLPSFGQRKINGKTPNLNAYWWVEYEEGSPSSEVRVFTKRGTALKPSALRFVTTGKNINLVLSPTAQILEVTAFYNNGQKSADFYEEVRHQSNNSIPLARIITINGRSHELRLTQLAVQAFDPQFPQHHSTHPEAVGVPSQKQVS